MEVWCLVMVGLLSYVFGQNLVREVANVVKYYEWG
jgi:hypothetical protein